ncbi:MAG: 4Fe-4S cluster-binding domain-containing protein [Candidatus Lokiarchaeota archaeon]|nr:4Fe-4S cluster-binding domain-containing protein [Candidatus Lokiarchaeota archaeon]
MRKNSFYDSGKGTFLIKGRGIPKGCQICLKGAKTVLFLNGLCQNPDHCYWYCPISEERKNKSLMFANEIQINTKEEILDEINNTNALGMGITGGDPLFTPNIKSTLEIIRFIRHKMGKKFHIHLYSNGVNFDENLAIDLANSGLDEIRFNPSRSNWNVIKLALKKGMQVGAEVPLIPQNKYLNELEQFIIYLDKIGADFLNINEFEYSVSNSAQLKDRGYDLKNGTIASVENSKEMAFELIERMAPKVSIKIHFCTIIAKDYWQLSKRYYRRAKKIRKPYESISPEGLLIYSQIEGPLDKLHELKEEILKNANLKSHHLEIDTAGLKLSVEASLNDDIIQLVDKKGLKFYILETTPFREEKYKQITEKSPINVFWEDFGLNEDRKSQD